MESLVSVCVKCSMSASSSSESLFQQHDRHMNVEQLVSVTSAFFLIICLCNSGRRSSCLNSCRADGVHELQQGQYIQQHRMFVTTCAHKLLHISSFASLSAHCANIPIQKLFTQKLCPKVQQSGCLKNSKLHPVALYKQDAEKLT